MNKSDFLAALRDRLSGLPTEDIDSSVDYYGEMIDDRIEDGLSEEDAVLAVGSPDEIAAQVLMDTPLPKLVRQKVKSGRSLSGWVIALLILGSPLWISLLAAAFAILLSVFVVIFTLIAVLYIVDFSIGISGAAIALASFVFTLTGKAALGAISLGGGLVLTGLSILLFPCCNAAAKGLLLLCKKILLGIKSCFIKREAVK